MNSYKVTFVLQEGYSPKETGFVSITVIVKAYDQFDALSTAWNKCSTLDLGESKSFTATKLENCT